ncbi:MAG TPA: cob(I)yrinic acid a,c-diamide adenosyltransferase [Thermodesulfobacteriota bacterium]|nr:cob(I)yrinic acid a,c-diamide adenosyltransferase [Thermodesulfobacteriota bacterium]
MGCKASLEPNGVQKWEMTMPISTRKGDKGFTHLLGGRRVPKFHLRPETYGTLDELNAFVGMAKAASKNKKVRETLFTIQNHFYLISSDLALPGKDRSLLKEEIGQKEVDWLSQLSKDFESSLKPDPKFIVYGETFPSSVLDVARAISRRTERLVAKMKSKRMLHNPKILEYLNRLSDVLYLLARYEEKRANIKPIHPQICS